MNPTLMALLALCLCLLGCGKEGASEPQTGTKTHSKQFVVVLKNEKPLSNDILVLKALAEKGDAMAQNSLGMKYYHGEEVAEDNTEAMKWYHRAAEQGHGEAQYHLGAMYEDGRGVLENGKEAVKWYLAAAEQGNALSQYYLGMMYYDGAGVERNYVTAYAWWLIADYNGNAYARNARETLFVKLKEKFTPDQIAEAYSYRRELLKKYPKAENYVALREPTFDRDILPIIKQHCTNCHGKDNQKGKLRMDSFAEFSKGADGKAIFVARKPGESEIYRRLTLPDHDDARMPRKGNRIPEPVAKLIKRWIEQGAKQ